MQSVLTSATRFARLFKTQRSKVRISSFSQEQNPPLFQRNVPWWARWTWGLIACDIFMTGSAIELTYNHWTTLNDQDPGGNSKEPNAAASEAYVLRPIWQRAGVCTAHLVFGAGIAAALLITQTRFVRTLSVVPSSGLAEGRRVFLQCAHNIKRNGVIFPSNRCSIGNGRNDTEVILRVKGEIGHWFIGFEDCQINGRHHSEIDRRRAEFLAGWESRGIEKSLKRGETRIDSRWKSGPLRRAAGR